jgi:hypothetical protein
MSLATPDDNYDGYVVSRSSVLITPTHLMNLSFKNWCCRAQNTDVSRLASNFAGRHFMLAHGTADGNFIHSVHYHF